MSRGIYCGNCGDELDDVQLTMCADNRVHDPRCRACWELELQIAIAKCGLATRAANKSLRRICADFAEAARGMGRAMLAAIADGRDPDELVRETLEELDE